MGDPASPGWLKEADHLGLGHQSDAFNCTKHHISVAACSRATPGMPTCFYIGGKNYRRVAATESSYFRHVDSSPRLQVGFKTFKGTTCVMTEETFHGCA